MKMLKPQPMQKPKVLVVPPFIGELGHECFCWNGLIRKAARDFETVYVYGSAGKECLYEDFANYIVVDVPKKESECLAWTNFLTNQGEYWQLVEACIDHAKKELNLKEGEFGITTLNNIPNMAMPYYEMQEHHKIQYDDSILDALKIPRDKKRVVLCVRERGLSEYRNWDKNNWISLDRYLTKAGLYPIMVGAVSTKLELALSCTNHSLLNKTSLTNCAKLLCNADLVVGGSTGTMHLASLCGANHLVWGMDKNVDRYTETNWFGADFKVVVSGFDPDPVLIRDEVEFYFNNNRFFGKRKD